jgi:hypothetical protein
MKGHTHQTRRLHLPANSRQPDVFMGTTDTSEPEPASVIPTPLSDSYRQYSSWAEATSAT